jgi:hypothetical protein
MSSSYGISHRRRANSARRCSASGCYNYRRGLSGFCAGHERRRNIYGSPTGQKIGRREYAMERHEFETFIDKYLQHEGIQLAIEWLQGCLDDAADGVAMPHGLQWARLHTGGVSAKHILVEAGALWLYSLRRANRLPDDERLTYAIGTAVLHLAPRASRTAWVNGMPARRYQRLSGRARQAFGHWLREELGVLFLQMAYAIQAAQQQSHDRKRVLGAPFEA